MNVSLRAGESVNAAFDLAHANQHEEGGEDTCNFRRRHRFW